MIGTYHKMKYVYFAAIRLAAWFCQTDHIYVYACNYIKQVE